MTANQTVGIVCRLIGFTVADGNNWWYLVGSSPWNAGFYVSADPFYNNGATTGSLHGTPFYDPLVPLCPNSAGQAAATVPPSAGSGTGSSGSAPPTTPTYGETVGVVTHTWTNYTNAGGTEGQSVAAYQTVQVACRVQGFAVADGNTWWYQIASSPWSGVYYASADAFYNNGQTSGSLVGTPFYDLNVPLC